jgi:hypothetical protein
MRATYGKFLGLFLALFCLPVTVANNDDKSEKQKKAAEELWKTLLAKDSPNLHETDNFLLIGSMDVKAMEKAGKALEKHWPLVLKNLFFEEDDDKFKLWEGKLVIHLCKERAEFRTLYRKMKRETPLDDEISIYHHDGVVSYIVVGPPMTGKSPLPLEVEIVGQLGAATLTRKRTARLPPWFVTGYARSHAYRFSPKAFVRERNAAYLLLVEGKKIGDVYSENNMSPAAVAVLRGSFVDFLSQSPQMKDYWKKILGKIDDQTSLDQIWEQIRVKGDEVQQAWGAWSKSPR